MTQKEWVLRKLLNGDKMSTVLAWNYGIKQLPVIIWRLKNKHGYNIQSVVHRDNLLNRNYTTYELA